MAGTVADRKRVVCWGYPQTDLHSHRHIWKGFYSAARKLGVDAVMLPDTPSAAETVTADDIVFVIDIWSSHLPLVKGARYVAHNVPGNNILFDTIAEKDWIRLQAYTSTAAGEKWGACRFWLAENRTLTQPWGTDLFAEEFYEPVFNPSSRDAVFVGAVWNTDGQGNAHAITELRAALGKRGLRFDHRTQIGEEEMITLIRAARIAPAIAGEWQVANNYLPCRVFKNVSYGQIALTNVPRFFDLFGDCSLQADGMEGLVDEALSLRRGEYAEMVLEQQRVVSRFTYRESLEAITRAFES